MESRRQAIARLAVITALAVACAAALGACGSSGAASASSGATSAVSRSSLHAAGLRFADCMRSHGVPNFPDPPAGGGGIQINAGSGIDPRSPAFQSAQKACGKLLPAPGGGRGPGSESRKLELLRLARCMRAHGVPAFPDPTSSPPSGPPAGGGIAFGAPGSFLSVPQSLIQSPAFSHAAAICGFPGRGLPPKAAAVG